MRHISWAKAEADAIASIDQNNDGKLDIEDLKIAKNRVLPILTAGLPGAGGFAGGFLVGLKF